MDARHEDLFVVRAVEDADPATLGKHPLAAPKEVMPELLGRGLREAADVDPLRVDPSHHLLYGAVFPGRVRPLEHEEDCGRRLGEQAVLVLRQ